MSSVLVFGNDWFLFSDLGGRGSPGGLCSSYFSGFLVRGHFGGGLGGLAVLVGVVPERVGSDAWS